MEVAPPPASYAASEDACPSPLRTIELTDEEKQRRRYELIHLPERIFLCVDVSAEMGREYGTGGQTRLTLIKRMLRSFIYYKGVANPKHQFAIVQLSSHGAPIVLQAFTTDPRDLTSAIESLQIDGYGASLTSSPTAPPELDLDQFLQTLRKHTIPEPPGMLTRAIIIYGRSDAGPLLSNPDSLSLLQRETFFVDLLYLHRPIEEAPSVQDIFSLLAGYLDEKNPLVDTNLFIDIINNTQRLMYFMQMLLAHPLHRDDMDTFLKKVDMGFNVPLAEDRHLQQGAGVGASPPRPFGYHK